MALGRLARLGGRWLLPALAALSAALGVALLSGVPWSGASAPRAPKVGAEVAVTPTDQLVQPSNNSPVIVADPTNDRLLALANRLDAPDFGCALHLSGDGGESWMPVSPLQELPPGADKCYAPEVAFDRRGTLHFLFVGLQGEGNEPMGAFLATSDDDGRSFGQPRRVLGPLNFGVRMAVDPSQGERGRIHLVWLHANADPPLGGFPSGPNPILAAHSDDGGTTFSEPVQVSDPSRSRVVAPALALGPDRAVHVAYYDLRDDARDYQGLEGPVWEGRWSVVVATSLDGGRGFAAGVAVDDEIAPPERPMLIFTMAPPALVAGSDRVCAAWTDARHGDPDVLSRCSSRTGGSWEALRRVNDDPVGNGIRQYLPRLSMAPGGRLDAVFLDRRHDPDNADNDVSYTFSDDGGGSFAPSQRLTTRSWSPKIGARYVGPAAAGQYEIGGRLGLVSSRSGVVAAWPDTRWAGAPRPGRTEQDVFAAAVRLPSADRAAWARAAGAALLAAGVAGAVVVALRRLRRQARDRPGQGGRPADMDGTGSAETLPHREGPRSAPGRAAGAIVAAALAGAVVALVAEERHGSTVEDLKPQVVDVTMTEHRFDYKPPPRGGRTVFRIRNAGQVRHAFELSPLPADMPPLDAQLRGAERRPINSFVDLGGTRPGAVATFAADLEAGQRYALLCLLRTPPPDERVHALLGMNTEFRPG